MNNLVGISYLRCLEVLDVSQNDIKDLRVSVDGLYVCVLTLF